MGKKLLVSVLLISFLAGSLLTGSIAFGEDGLTKLQKKCAKEPKNPQKIKPVCELLAMINAIPAGPQSIETIQVDGLLVEAKSSGPSNNISIASCPTSHPFLIGGSHTFRSIDSSPGAHIIIPLFDTDTNTYEVEGSVSSGNGIEFQAHALCAKLL